MSYCIQVERLFFFILQPCKKISMNVTFTAWPHTQNHTGKIM